MRAAQPVRQHQGWACPTQVFKKPDPKELVRKWQADLRAEQRKIDRQIRGEAAAAAHCPLKLPYCSAMTASSLLVDTPLNWAFKGNAGASGVQ